MMLRSHHRSLATLIALPATLTLTLALTHVARAQVASTPSRQAIFVDNDDRSGPRIGVAYIAGGSVTAERAGRSLSPLTSLFGWQVEHQFPAGPDLPLPVTELVATVGGMEQGRALPSLSWILGLRQRSGWEFGVGPMVTGAGVQLVFAGGITHAVGELNVPVNLAIAPGRRGAAISLTTGFNLRR